MTTTPSSDPVASALEALEPLASEKWVQGLKTQLDKPDTDRKQFQTKLHTKLGEKRKQTKHAKHVTHLDAALAALQPVQKPPMSAADTLYAKRMAIIRAYNAKYREKK
jgi:hypothetical protein